MKLEYRQSRPPSARTWFAQFPPHQTQELLRELTRYHTDICEASVLGTDRDRELWQIATTPDHRLWHRAQQHRNQPNTMLSVLAGSIQKLSMGGDLTEKQLGHVLDITLVMRHFGYQEITITEASASPRPQQGMQALRDNLFYYG